MRIRILLFCSLPPYESRSKNFYTMRVQIHITAIPVPVPMFLIPKYGLFTIVSCAFMQTPTMKRGRKKRSTNVLAAAAVTVEAPPPRTRAVRGSTVTASTADAPAQPRASRSTRASRVRVLCCGLGTDPCNQCCGLRRAARFWRLRSIFETGVAGAVFWSRAVDPDPHGSAFNFPPGSGSRRVNLSTKN